MSVWKTYTIGGQMQIANKLDEAIIQNLKKIGFEITPYKTIKV